MFRTSNPTRKEKRESVNPMSLLWVVADWVVVLLGVAMLARVLWACAIALWGR